MGTLYDRADIYDLMDSEAKHQVTRAHWQRILKSKRIHTLLDVSIGSGNLTLPLAPLGLQLYGSDLSQTMLDKCRQNADAENFAIDLRCCDFRRLTEHFTEQFDCVASSGNSLAYVTNSEVCRVLEQMDALVKDGGYLYFDLRNWDKIKQNNERFYFYNPVFDGGTRINLMQVWDHLEDGSINFNLLYTFERNNHIVQKEHFVEHYHPVSRQFLLNKLTSMGYETIETLQFPTQFGLFDPEKTDWYCIIAQKRNS